jgi:SRSO17 transposase
MSIQIRDEMQGRLRDYLDRIRGCLKDKRKRESFAIYAFGLLGDTERKSAEPIAAAACGDPASTQHMHDKLLHFVGQSSWSDEQVRLEASRYVCEVLGEREDLTTFVIDDTGFLKQGTESPGVQRQYTGSAGKVANCQIGVSLEIATGTQHAPVDMELYLPESWTENSARRDKAHIPDNVKFKTKIELALQMLERAARHGLPGEIVLADSAYGDSSDFRETVRMLGFDYAVGVKPGTKVRRLGANGKLGKVLSVGELAKTIPKKERRRVTWRQGTKSALSGRFSFCRVKPTHDDGEPIETRSDVWLVVEWPDKPGERKKFYLSTLPRRMSHKQLVRTIKERWRTEQMYRDMKGELGLDHFEGRTFTGWHHHVSVAIACYAFVVAERAHAFPPSGERKCDLRSQPLAA